MPRFFYAAIMIALTTACGGRDNSDHQKENSGTSNPTSPLGTTPPPVVEASASNSEPASPKVGSAKVPNTIVLRVVSGQGFTGFGFDEVLTWSSMDGIESLLRGRPVLQHEINTNCFNSGSGAKDGITHRHCIYAHIDNSRHTYTLLQDGVAATDNKVDAAHSNNQTNVGYPGGQVNVNNQGTANGTQTNVEYPGGQISIDTEHQGDGGFNTTVAYPGGSIQINGGNTNFNDNHGRDMSSGIRYLIYVLDRVSP